MNKITLEDTEATLLIAIVVVCSPRTVFSMRTVHRVSPFPHCQVATSNYLSDPFKAYLPVVNQKARRVASMIHTQRSESEPQRFCLKSDMLNSFFVPAFQTR